MAKNRTTNYAANNSQMEAYCLGAMLVDKSCIRRLFDVISPQMFGNDELQPIAQIIHDLYKEGRPVDYITVYDELKKNHSSITYSGIDTLMKLTNNVVNTDGVPMQHAAKIKDYYVRRTFLHHQNEMADRVRAFEDMNAIISENRSLNEWIVDVNESGQKTDYHSIYDKVIWEAKQIQDGKEPPYLPSLYPSLDRKISGWMPGNMITIAGRPGMGKTAFLISAASRAAKAGRKIGIFSLEMSERELVARLLGMEVGIEPIRILNGKFDPALNDKLIQGSMAFRENIMIEACTNLKIGKFIARARYMVHTLGVQEIWVDYVQLMLGDKDHYQTREPEVAEISRGIKSTAKELHIPILALSQLSRATEKRDSKLPVLADLRESGAIEQDSDVVIFCYRPGYYKFLNQQGEELKDDVKLIIAKYRNSEVTEVKMKFDGPLMKFIDLKEEDDKDF